MRGEVRVRIKRQRGGGHNGTYQPCSSKIQPAGTPTRILTERRWGQKKTSTSQRAYASSRMPAIQQPYQLSFNIHNTKTSEPQLPLIRCSPVTHPPTHKSQSSLTVTSPDQHPQFGSQNLIPHPRPAQLHQPRCNRDYHCTKHYLM